MPHTPRFVKNFTKLVTGPKADSLPVDQFLLSHDCHTVFDLKSI